MVCADEQLVKGDRTSCSWHTGFEQKSTLLSPVFLSARTRTQIRRHNYQLPNAQLPSLPLFPPTPPSLKNHNDMYNAPQQTHNFNSPLGCSNPNADCHLCSPPHSPPPAWLPCTYPQLLVPVAVAPLPPSTPPQAAPDPPSDAVH